MADSQSYGDDPNDTSLNLFDFDGYYKGDCAGPESALPAGSQAFNDPRASYQHLSLEPRQERVDSLEALNGSYIEGAALVVHRNNSWGGSSMLVANTGSGPLHQYEQPSNTENKTAEIHQIEDKLKKKTKWNTVSS